MIVAIDYASPSVFESTTDRAFLGISANQRRPVRFHGRLIRNIPLFRFTLRALGEAIWSNDTWSSDGERMSWILDPVITVHPDRIFFEAFSQDQSVYAMVIANPAMFALDGDMTPGTTNIDFTAWLWGALNELRSSRETWLRVGSQGVEIKTKGAGGRFEKKVDLPDQWVRGFLQVSGAMAMPGTRITVSPADLLAAIRFLRYTKARVSPRAVRYEFTPGEDARLVLEPWEHTVRLRGAEHAYTEPRIIRTWGRRRLKLIEPLLPFATSVDIYLKGRGLPSFYAVKLPDLTFLLGLSGSTEQNWGETGNFDLLGDARQVDLEILDGVQMELERRFHASPRELAEALGQTPTLVGRALERLCRRGRAMFDVESRDFRHRELFESGIDEEKLFPPDPRTEAAQEWLSQKAVSIQQCEPQETRKIKRLKTPDGPTQREVIYRDWRVNGVVGPETTEIVVADSGRIIFGTCGCPFFQENLLGKGPCEHMIALFQASHERRRDLPTSQAVSPAIPSSTGADDKEEGFDTEEGEEEGEDK